MKYQNILGEADQPVARGWMPVNSVPGTDEAGLKAEIARTKLVRTLQSAYSGELGAIFAYRGHARSVSQPEEKAMILRIEYEEVLHRRRVGEMLEALGESPSLMREKPLGWVGKTLGVLCSWTGWFAPMYGAGLLESRNIREYEDAALYALNSGHLEFLDDLLLMAEIEWQHEKYFREQCRTHFLFRWVPKWNPPSPLENIRKPFAAHFYPWGKLRRILTCQRVGLPEMENERRIYSREKPDAKEGRLILIRESGYWGELL